MVVARRHSRLHAGDDDAVRGRRGRAPPLAAGDRVRFTLRVPTTGRCARRRSRWPGTTQRWPRRCAAGRQAATERGSRRAMRCRRSRSRRRRGVPFTYGRPPRTRHGGHVRLHALPGARVLPADGEAFPAGAAGARARARSRRRAAAQRDARSGVRYAAGARRLRHRQTGEPGAMAVRDRADRTRSHGSRPRSPSTSSATACSSTTRSRRPSSTRDGRVVEIWRGNGWSTGELVAVLRRVAAGTD